MTDTALSDEITITLGDSPATDAFGMGCLLDDIEHMETVMAAGPGIFRTRRRQADVPVAALAQFLTRDTTLGFLQRGPLLLPVPMPCDGWLLAAVADGERVQHGSSLFRILRATDMIIP